MSFSVFASSKFQSRLIKFSDFRISQVGCFLHLGSLMNLDFGNIIKEGSANVGQASSTSESLPPLFGSAPNFTAAVIFFVALWNSWWNLFAQRMRHCCFAAFTLVFLIINKSSSNLIASHLFFAQGTCSPTTWCGFLHMT
jgi:hypothetical protein